MLWFREQKTNDISKQIGLYVQPKAEMDLQFESTKLSTPLGYLSAITFSVTTFGRIALISGFFLKPNATLDDYLANVVPFYLVGFYLFWEFLSFLVHDKEDSHQGNSCSLWC